MNAIMTALAMLPTQFEELELYMTVASLSYTGDPRMGIGENPNKVTNLVTPMLPAYRTLYKNALQSFGTDFLRSVYLPQGDRTVFIQDDRMDTRRFLLSRLPLSIQRELQTSPRLQLSSAEDVKNAVATVVARTATPQTVTGLFTAGFTKSAAYAAAKIAKRFK